MQSSGKKSERMVQLELLLMSHPEGMRRAEIARRLGVHRATVGRYIDELSTRIPIWEKEYRVGLEVNQLQECPRMGLLECLTLYLALGQFADWVEAHNPPAAAAVRKTAGFLKVSAPFLSRRLYSIADRIDGDHKPSSGESINLMEQLAEAWIAGKKVSLSFYPEKGEDMICSIISIDMGHIFSGTLPVTLSVRLSGKDEYRLIHLGHIRTVEILLEKAEANEEYLSLLRYFDHKGHQVEPIPCEIRYTDDYYLPFLQRISATKLVPGRLDGARAVKIEALSQELLFGILLCSAGAVEIIAPTSLKKSYKQILEHNIKNIVK